MHVAIQADCRSSIPELCFSQILGERALSPGHLIALLTIAVIVLARGEAPAQGTFPAPLAGQTGQPSRSAGAPPIAGVTSPSASAIPDGCQKEYRSLWADASKRGQLIRAAAERRAPLNEACELMNSYGQAEIKLIEYAESHAARCGFSAEFRDQLSNSHKNSAAVQKRTCGALMQKGEPTGPSGDFGPPSTMPPG